MKVVLGIFVALKMSSKTLIKTPLSYYMSFVRRFYPKRLTYTQYCGQSPQEQFGVKCLAQGHMLWLQWDSNSLSPDSKSSTLPTEPQRPCSRLTSYFLLQTSLLVQINRLLNRITTGWFILIWAATFTFFTQKIKQRIWMYTGIRLTFMLSECEFSQLCVLFFDKRVQSGGNAGSTICFAYIVVLLWKKKSLWKSEITREENVFFQILFFENHGLSQSKS